jgi:uncharacterized protein YhfF
MALTDRLNHQVLGGKKRRTSVLVQQFNKESTVAETKGNFTNVLVPDIHTTIPDHSE